MNKKNGEAQIRANKKKWIAVGAGLTLLVLGVIVTVVTRSGALAENAEASNKVSFALGLIMTLVGIVIPIVASVPEKKKTDVRTLSMAALFAALCYIGFTYCKIDIPVGMEKTAFHLGNVFCVLAALFLGGLWGGMAGAVGMTIADLTTAYVTSAPKTFLLKLCIGLITGFVAHKIFKISQDKENRKVPLTAATASFRRSLISVRRTSSFDGAGAGAAAFSSSSFFLRRELRWAMDFTMKKRQTAMIKKSTTF